jgi:hypothetical protein
MTWPRLSNGLSEVDAVDCERWRAASLPHGSTVGIRVSPKASMTVPTIYQQQWLSEVNRVAEGAIQHEKEKLHRVEMFERIRPLHYT